MRSAVVPGAPTYQKVVPLAVIRCGDPSTVRDLLGADGVVRDGHFSLLSGLHTNSFIAFSALARDHDSLRTIAGWLAPTVAAWAPDVILAPSTAGVSLAAELARQVSARLELALVDDEGRPAELFAQNVSGKRVVVANDVVTTGTGLRKLSALATAGSATVVGAAWFVTRGPLDAPKILGVPGAHVADLDLGAWAQDSCPLCQDGAAVELARDLN